MRLSAMEDDSKSKSESNSNNNGSDWLRGRGWSLRGGSGTRSTTWSKVAEAESNSMSSAANCGERRGAAPGQLGVMEDDSKSESNNSNIMAAIVRTAVRARVVLEGKRLREINDRVLKVAESNLIERADMASVGAGDPCQVCLLQTIKPTAHICS